MWLLTQSVHTDVIDKSACVTLPLLRTYRCGGDVNEQGEGFKCDRCGRSCALFENPDVRNEQIRQRILEQAEKQKSKK